MKRWIIVLSALVLLQSGIIVKQSSDHRQGRREGKTDRLHLICRSGHAE
jgi:hypothetical protein